MQHSQIFRLASALALATLTLAGCSDSSHSYVKFIHASPGAPNVDVKVGSTFATQNTAYSTATSGYAQVSAGTDRKVQVFAAGKDSAAVLSTTQTFMKNQYYTILALDVPSKVQAHIENDDLTPPASGKCKVRVAHGSPTAGPVDVYVTGPGTVIDDPAHPVAPVLSNFGFGTVTKYLQVPAGLYQIRVTAPGKPGQVAIDTGASGVSLAAGNIYTAVALDPNPSSNPPGKAFTLSLTQDQPVAGVVPVAPAM